MAQCRTIMLSAVVAVGTSLSGASVARAETRATPVQWTPERQYAPAPYTRPMQQPRGRQVCWTQQSRVMVGYDRFGRPMYRSVPRRVCRWQHY